MGRFARTLSLAVLLSVCSSAAALAADPVTRGAEVVQRDVAATCRVAGGPCQPEASEAAVAAFERSGTHDALVFQHRLADDVGFVDAPWVGTHNSFNSIAQLGPTVSDLDSNQQLTVVDQLRLGVRSVELDMHLWLGRPTFCHGQGASSAHAGCTVEGEAAPILEQVAGWVRAHPGQVVLLYLEDHLVDEAGYDAGAAVVRETLGDVLYAPRGAGCTQLPATLTRRDVLRAGKQVVVVSDCGPGAGWNGVAHAWDLHEESRPRGFDEVSCGPDFDRADYDGKLVRYFEDSTWLTTTASYAGQASQDDGLTPATTAAMVRCGVDLLGFDQLVPGDGRLAASVWSWGEGQPAAGTCAVQRADGRWASRACTGRLPAACRDEDGSWSVTRAVKRSRAARACADDGATLAAPRTGRENALLRAAAAERAVWLGLGRAAGRWAPVDAR